MPLERWQRQASPTTRSWILREGAATSMSVSSFCVISQGNTSAIEGRSEDFRDVLIGKCFAEPALAHEPAEPYNRFRDIKLGSIKSVSALKLRAAPFSIMVRLGVIEQVLPLSNFYFKVKLAEGVTDAVFGERLIAYNRSIGDLLFHSFTDGTETFDLNWRVKHKYTPQRSRPVFVVDFPPVGISLDTVHTYFQASFGATGIVVRWAEGPKEYLSHCRV